MIKKLFWVFLLLSTCIPLSLGHEFDFSAQAEAVTGAGNDLDFNKNTHESVWYASGRFKPRFEFTANDNISFAGEYQISNFGGAQGTQGGSFASDNNNFKILDSYIKISREGGDYIKTGWQEVALPSFTFGNPFFNGYTSAAALHGALSQSTCLNVIMAIPLRTQDNMPKENSAKMVSFIVDVQKEKFAFRPYLAFVRADHDINSPYNWAAAPNNSISYITAGGFAAKYNIDKKTTVAADAVYGDENNKGGHYYESKGSHLALLVEREEDYATAGFFVWHSSGNKGETLYHHWDYGFLPAVATEQSFAPSRLAFKGAGALGRDSIISSTSLGTAGFGVHIKNINTTDKLTHTVRGVYIRGTSSAQQEGNSAGTQVPSLARPAETEPGIMGDKDYAVEFDFDSNYKFSRSLEGILQMGYIISGFKKQQYDRNIFNIQMIMRVFFD